VIVECISSEKLYLEAEIYDVSALLTRDESLPFHIIFKTRRQNFKTISSSSAATE